MTFRRLLPAVLFFCCLTPLHAKDYTDPAGAFAIRLPDNWQTQRSQVEPGIWFTQLSTGARGESLNILSVPVPQPAQGEALDATGRALIGLIVEILKAQSEVQVTEAVRAQFDEREALRAELTVRHLGITETGYILVVPGQRHILLLIIGAPQGDEAALKRVEANLASLAVESNQPKAGVALPPAPAPDIAGEIKTGIPHLPTTGDARFDALLRVLVEDRKDFIALNKAFLTRTANQTPANAVQARTAFFEANVERLAAPEGSKERALAARRAMDRATDMAWQAFDARNFDEASIWFERRAALRRESYQAAQVHQETLFHQRFAESAQLGIGVPDDELQAKRLFRGTLAMMTIQNERLYVIRVFAHDSNDATALLKYSVLGLELHRNLLDLFQKSKFNVEAIDDQKALVAEAYENVGEAQMALARFDDAEKSLQEALQIRRALPADSGIRALHLSLSAMGELREHLGDLPGARDYYQQALAACEADAPARAKLLMAEADPDTKTRRHAEFVTAQATIVFTLANVLFSMDRHQEALKQSEQALKIAETLPAEGDFSDNRNRLRLRSLILNAAIHGESGDTETALRELKELAPLWRSVSGEGGLIASLMSALMVYEVLYQRGEITDDQIREARSYAEQIHRIHASTQNLNGLALVTYFLAAIDNELNDLPNADKNATEALTLARKIEDASSISGAQQILAKVRLKQNRADEALASLAEADQFAARVASPLSQAEISDVRGQVLEQKGDLNGALAAYKKAIALMESVRAAATSESNFSSLKSRYEVYERIVKLLIKMGRGEEAFDYLGRAKSKQLQDNLRLTTVRSPNPNLQALLDRFSGVETKLQSVTTQLQVEQAKPAAEQDNAKIETLKTLVASTQGEYRRVFEEIKTKHPNWESNLTVKPRELKATQSSIPPGVVLVQYAPIGEQIYIFVVMRDSLKIHTPAAKADDVWKRIQDLRRLIVREGKRGLEGANQTPANNDSTSLIGNSLALYEMLVQPIEADLKEAKTIAIIPNQSLYYLPFHALARRDGNKIRYLIEDKEVVYLTGADVMRVVQAPNANKKRDGLIAFGNPTGAELPASLEEVKAIAAIYPQSQILTGAAATKSAVTAPGILDKRVVHFATHGFLNSSVPSQSYIQLAKGGPPQSEQLTVNEVWDLPLKNVDLVTLSACESALSQRNPDGGDITTLAEAFSTAGATTVTCSLWSVADESTKELMVEFYKQLAGGATKAAALRAAQLKVMRSPQTSHPFHWAPFILMGDWR